MKILLRPTLIVTALLGLCSLNAAPLLNTPSGDVFSPDFSKPLGKEWSVAKGEWTAKEGVLHGSELASEKHAAVLWHPGRVDSLILTTEFKMGDAKILYFGVDGKGHVGRLVIRNTLVGLYDDSPDAATGKSTSKPLATAQVKLDPQTWYPVTYELRGDEMVAQVAGVTLKAKAPYFATEKTRYWIAVSGPDLQLRSFKSSEGKPNPKWPEAGKDAVSSVAPPAAVPAAKKP